MSKKKYKDDMFSWFLIIIGALLLILASLNHLAEHFTREGQMIFGLMMFLFGDTRLTILRAMCKRDEE